MKWMFVSLMCMCLPTTGFAQEIEERFEHNFDQTHDRGLYARVGVGTHYSSSLISPPAKGIEKDESKGWSMATDIQLGGYVADQFVLHLSQWSQLGIERGLLQSGLGVTYYFNEHSNWFISAMAGAATLYDAAPDISLFDQWGLAGQLQLGTGWWIASNSSLGVTLSVGGVHADLDGDGVVFASWQGGISAYVSFD